MNYEDQLKHLEDQIRLEFQRDNTLSKRAPLKFKTPSDVLVFLSRLPVNRNVEVTSLSPFLRRFRRNANLDLQDVSIAVNVPARTIIQFESGELLPWTLDPSAMVALACAYRIHIEAIDFLTKNSHQIARVSKAIADPAATQASMSQWLEAVRTEISERDELTLTT
jgi:transcriptional regulator with XRE-family HTH domain